MPTYRPTFIYCVATIFRRIKIYTKQLYSVDLAALYTAILYGDGRRDGVRRNPKKSPGTDSAI